MDYPQSTRPLTDSESLTNKVHLGYWGGIPVLLATLNNTSYFIPSAVIAAYIPGRNVVVSKASLPFPKVVAPITIPHVFSFIRETFGRSQDVSFSSVIELDSQIGDFNDAMIAQTATGGL